jgi:hypothetical protein
MSFAEQLFEGAHLGKQHQFGDPAMKGAPEPVIEVDEEKGRKYGFAEQLMGTNSLENMAGYGRGNDSMVVHVTPGEIMIPPEMIARNPELGAMIGRAFAENGLNPHEYMVGSGEEKINPITGQPEFGFFSRVWKSAKKVVKKVVSTAKKVVTKVAENPILAAAATVLTAGALTPVLGSAALAGAVAGTGWSLAGGNDIKTALLSGATSALGGAVASKVGNFASSALGDSAGQFLSKPVGSLIPGLTLQSTPSLGGKLLAGLGSQSIGKVAGAALLGGLAPKVLGSLAPEQQMPSIGFQGAPQTAYYQPAMLPAPGTGQTAQDVGQTTGDALPQRGAGQLPGTLAAATPDNVSYSNPVRDRYSGAINYVDTPFSGALSSLRRGSFGSLV